VVNPRDEVAFKRMVRLLPGIGQRSAEQLWRAVDSQIQGPAIQETTGAVISFAELLLPQKVPAKARQSWEQLAYTLAEIAPEGRPLPPAQMIHSVIEAGYDDYLKAKFPNYEARREDLHTLYTYAQDFPDPAEFLDQLALVSNVDNATATGSATTEDQEKVTLSSIHQAKGLEWRIVFVIWMAEGMFPSNRSLESEEAIEEERRLFYVAVTRAEDELYLTYPLLNMNSHSGEIYQRPSRFLQEIPKELLDEWQVSGSPF
jgi:DNA helicase-2/ATP-dependent DNA helicase PcrA